jgi:hypothetical protein
MKYAGEFLVLIVYAAIIYTLVRPKSQGPKLVTSVTGGLANLVKAGTGGGKF